MYKKISIIILLLLSLLQANASDIATIQILGTGAESLLKGDLTDPDNNGLDALGAATDPSWNWVSINSSHEPDFEGGENSFNIFDNKVGGGNDKWCCDDPTVDAPVWVAVEFANPVSLTHFTVTSGNDSPDRDPTDWQIQGSNDGTTYFPIYSFQDSTASWATATRNQVIKFTLLSPSAPYKFIRYIAFATPGTLHQINEIEYFGATGGSDKIAVSGIRAGLTSFAFSATDVGTSVVNAANTTATINGAPVVLTNTKVDGVTTFTYTPATPFQSGKTNDFVVTAKDGSGNTVTVSGAFVTPTYAYLTAADKVTPDTTKPGFVFNVTQNPSFQENRYTRAENQLAGALGVNFADPAAQGPALAPGTPGATTRLPVHFDVATVINMDQDAANAGDISPDDMIPGIPSLSPTAPADGIAAEIITYVEVPAGLHTFIFNSDDGFRTTVGNVGDVFQARQAGLFNDGRGATDTTYPVYAQEAGVYAFRTVWFEGGGGANLEWKTVGSDGVTEVLINDTANGGLKAYRAITGAAPTVISSVFPYLNQTGVSGDTSIRATITEGATAVDLSSVKISLNGVQQTDAATKAGNVITISHASTALLPANTTNTATITYTAGGTARSETWTFFTGNYQTITADKRVTPDTTKPGFIWMVHHNPNAAQGGNLRTLKQLAGLYGHNYADPTAEGTGYALAPATVPADDKLPITFEIPTVINMDQAAASQGEFGSDSQMPGIPGLSLNDGVAFQPDEGIAGDIITYIDLPAGKNTFIFNSDDGFRSFSGNSRDMFDAQMLGEFDAGRGAADTQYDFFVEAAGVYPFRTIWFEGGGGANLEWKYVKPDGTHVLINDIDNGGPHAYRAATAGAQTAITKVSPWPGYNRVGPKEAIEVVIEEGANLVTDASIQLSLNGTTVSPAATVTRTGKTITVRHVPTTAYTAGATNTAKIAFTVGGTPREETWTFVTPKTTPDKLNGYAAMMLGRVAISADAGGRTGQAGDKSADFGTSGGTAPGLLATDPALLSAINANAANDTLSVSFWGKKYNNNDSSAFWFDSPGAMQTMRGFQAHTPWSNGRIYFDTSGCCGAGVSRIDQAVDSTTVPDFVDATWWTTQWHHFAFIKNANVKEIWVDGVLFHSGDGAPLFSDFARVWIGAIGGGPDSGPGNPFPGLIDDFAIFGGALAQADIVALKNGTAPSALPVATKPLAWWDFNGGGVNPGPTLSASVSGGNITLTFTGKLQSSPVVGTGAVWTDVSTSGTHTESTSTGNKFFRAVQ
ncbi:MAG TPA: LamG-like jellyroll fold domain-containing protein [Verrucomicrobiae bacterium]|nr:LamG-like jellyroll fold domain-containing protein [Verrucomicrobiae bacterium]